VTDEHPRQREDVNARTVGGEIILLDRASNQIHQLNVTASFVWQRCDGRHTAAAIAEALTAAFDVDPDTARDAITAALRQFDQLGLLRSTGV